MGYKDWLADNDKTFKDQLEKQKKNPKPKYQRFKDEVTCPYCDFIFSDSWEFHETEFPINPIDIKCDECGEKFKTVVNCEVTYCSFPIKKEGSDE